MFKNEAGDFFREADIGVSGGVAWQVARMKGRGGVAEGKVIVDRGGAEAGAAGGRIEFATHGDADGVAFPIDEISVGAGLPFFQFFCYAEGAFWGHGGLFPARNRSIDGDFLIDEKPSPLFF